MKETTEFQIKEYVHSLRDPWNLGKFSIAQYSFLETFLYKGIESNTILCKKSKLFDLDCLEFFDEFALYMGLIQKESKALQISFVKKKIDYIWNIHEGYTIQDNINHINKFLNLYDKTLEVW